MAKDVVVVGAGFSGLTTAFFLTRMGHQVTIVEKSQGVGGLLGTETLASGIAESAANGVLNNDLFEEICRECGVEIISAKRESRARYFFRKEPRKFPLSLSESKKLLWHFLPRALVWRRGLKPASGESVWDWGQRHIGDEATRFLLGPALQGIYAGKLEQMSASLLYQRMTQKKSRRPRKRVRLKGLVAPKEGMGQVVRGLTEHLRSRGVRFRFGESFDYEIHAKTGEEVVLCTPLASSAEILQGRYPKVAERLRQVEMLPLVTATVFLPDTGATPRGFGMLLPRGEGYQALGVLFNGEIFPGRVLVPDMRAETWIFGGAHQKDVCSWSDDYILSRIQIERLRLFHERVEPKEFRIYRWEKALPHYNLALEVALSELNPLPRGLHLVGNYVGGIGLSQILEQAYEVTHRLHEGSNVT